jgi:hypothetical protein
VTKGRSLLPPNVALTRDAGKPALPFPHLEGRVKKLGLPFHRIDISTDGVSIVRLREIPPSLDDRAEALCRELLAPRSVERLLAGLRRAAIGRVRVES